MNEPTRRDALDGALELARYLLALAPEVPHSVGTIERIGQRQGVQLHFATATGLRAFAEQMGAEVAEQPLGGSGDVDLAAEGAVDGIPYLATGRLYAEAVLSPAAALAEQLHLNPEVLEAAAPYGDVLNVRLQADAEDWPQWLERYDATVIAACGPEDQDLAAVGRWSGITVQLIGIGLAAVAAPEDQGDDTEASEPSESDRMAAAAQAADAIGAIQGLADFTPTEES